MIFLKTEAVPVGFSVFSARWDAKIFLKTEAVPVGFSVFSARWDAKIFLKTEAVPVEFSVFSAQWDAKIFLKTEAVPVSQDSSLRCTAHQLAISHGNISRSACVENSREPADELNR